MGAGAERSGGPKADLRSQSLPKVDVKNLAAYNGIRAQNAPFGASGAFAVLIPAFVFPNKARAHTDNYAHTQTRRPPPSPRPNE